MVTTATAPSLFELAPPLIPALKERDVVRQVRDFLEYRGWKIVRNHVGRFVPSRCVMALIAAVQGPDVLAVGTAIAACKRNVITIGEEDTADILAIHPRLHPIWIEFKRPGGKATDGQLRFLREMREAYGFQARLVDRLDEFIVWYNDTQRLS